MTKLGLGIVIVGMLLLESCSINPYDKGEEPKISYKRVANQLVISWKPTDAWHIRVLEGEVDPKDPKNMRPPHKGLMWGLSDGENRVQSPVTYGKSQPGTNVHGGGKPLEPGKTYTIYVLRHDPKGSGGGFTNTHNMYEAVVTFVW